MKPTRITRLRTYTLRALYADSGLSVLLWAGYIADLTGCRYQLAVLSGAATTAILAGLAGLTAVVLTGQACIFAATHASSANAVYYHGYGDCAADRLPDPPEHD